MASSGIKTISILAISLAVLVICRTGFVQGATIPVVEVQKPVSEGLYAPVRLAMDAAGDLYVTDPTVKAVLHYNKYGKLIQTIPTEGKPQGVAITSAGNLVVSQVTFAALLDPQGNELRKLGQGIGQFQGANGIAIDGNGYIYVTDTIGLCVQVFTAAGDYAFRFGTVGSLAGQFYRASAIAYNKALNQVAVVDTMNGNVQFFDTLGTFVRKIGAYGNGPLMFIAPQGISFDYDTDPVTGNLVSKRMYVSDMFQNGVQVIDVSPAAPATGTYLSWVGNYGYSNGGLIYPFDCLFDGTTSRLIVSNGLANVVVYGIDGGKSPAVDPPALTIDPVAAETSQTSLDLTGTVSSTQSVGVTVLNTATGASVAGTVNGTAWSATVALASGANILNVTATDSLGNATTQTATVNLLLNPVALTINPVAGFSGTASQVLSGTVEVGATVTVTNQTTGVSGAATVNGTTWSYSVTLVEGTNSIAVAATKPNALNASGSAVITLDSAAPALTVSALPDKSYTNNKVQNIAGEVSEANLAHVTVNGQVITATSGPFSTAVTLVDGANSITVTATDLAGNMTTDSRTIYYDATAPVITIASPADGSYTKLANVTISGSVDKAATVMVGTTAATMDGNNWSAPVDLTLGVNTIDVVATDLYGNVSSQKRTVTFDNINPEVAITSPGQDLATNQATMTITGTASDADPVTLTSTFNGIDTPLTVTGGSYSFTVTFPADGQYPIVVTAVDAAGNVSTSVRTVIYDTTPPAVTIDTVPAQTDTAELVLTGTAEANNSVMVSNAAASTSEAATVNGTTWSYLATLVPGPNSITVQSIDGSGNVATVTAEVSYLLPAPTVVINPVAAITNVASQTITGSVDAGGTVSVAVNGGEPQAATVTEISWSFTVAGLVQGVNNITVTAVKPFTYTGSTSAAITLDTIAPSLSVSALANNSLTNSAAQNVSGTAADANLDRVTVNGQMASLVNGAFSSEVTLVPGTNTLTVQAFDLAGNVATDTRTITCDNSAPTLTLNPAPGETDSSSIALSGTVETGATVAVAGGGASVDATVSGNNWNATVSLVPGPNTVTVTATDEAGNKATQSAAITFFLPAPALAIAPVSPYTGVASQTIMGSVDAEGTVSVSLNGGAPQAATVSGTTWSYTALLGEGANKITATAAKPYSRSATAVATITLDSASPVLTVSALPDMSYTNNPTQNIAGTVSDANLDKVTVNEQEVPLVNGAFSTALTLAGGANVITVKGIDLAGNITTDSRTITFDNAAPVLTITSPADGSFTKLATATISGTTNKVTVVTVGGIAAQMNGNDWSATVSLAEGQNTVDVVATDLAGNVSQGKRTITYDSINPEVAIVSPAQDFATNNASITVTGTYNDADPVAVTGSVNGTSVPVTQANGTYSMTANFPAEGAYAIAVTATDAAGNVSTATRNVSYDSTPPVLTVTVTNKILSGTTDPGADVSLKDVNGKVNAPVTITGTSWTANLSKAVYDAKTLVVIAVDTAGNDTVVSVASIK